MTSATRSLNDAFHFEAGRLVSETAAIMQSVKAIVKQIGRHLGGTPGGHARLYRRSRKAAMMQAARRAFQGLGPWRKIRPQIASTATALPGRSVNAKVRQVRGRKLGPFLGPC